MARKIHLHRQSVGISIKDLLFYISKVAAKVMLDESIKTMEEEMKNFDELQRVEDPPRKINQGNATKHGFWHSILHFYIQMKKYKPETKPYN